MAQSTFRRRLRLTGTDPLITWDTLPTETPASSATSLIVEVRCVFFFRMPASSHHCEPVGKEDQSIPDRLSKAKALSHHVPPKNRPAPQIPQDVVLHSRKVRDILSSFLVSSTRGVKRESGGNPELPRSGEQRRTPILTLGRPPGKSG